MCRLPARLDFQPVLEGALRGDPWVYLLISQQITPEVVGESRLELETPGLEGRCSIQLSYSPVLSHCSVEWEQITSANAVSAAWSLCVASVAESPQAVR